VPFSNESIVDENLTR